MRSTASFIVNRGRVSQKNGSMKKEEIFLVEEGLDEISTPEKTLFLCVLLQALLDATKPVTSVEPQSAVLHRDRAIAWFFSSVGVTADDFVQVCDYAGVDPKYMRDFAFKVLRSGEVEYVRKRINAVLGH